MRLGAPVSQTQQEESFFTNRLKSEENDLRTNELPNSPVGPTVNTKEIRMLASDSNGTDAQILGIAHHIIEQLKIRDFKPSSVLWAEYIARKRVSQLMGLPFVSPFLKSLRPNH